MSHASCGSSGRHVFYSAAIASLVVALCLGYTTVGNAALLSVNSSIPAAAESDPAPGATSVQGPLVSNFNAPGVFSGTVTSQVWQNDGNNPYGLTNYTFTYLITSAATSSSPIERLSISGFASPTGSFQTDASYDSTFSSAPTKFTRSGPLNFGDIIGANFEAPGELLPGQSALIVIQTDSPNWSNNLAQVIDSAVVGNIPIYAPGTSNPAPEPSTLLLGAFGLVGLAAAMRTRRK